MFAGLASAVYPSLVSRHTSYGTTDSHRRLRQEVMFATTDFRDSRFLIYYTYIGFEFMIKLRRAAYSHSPASKVEYLFVSKSSPGTSARQSPKSQ